MNEENAQIILKDGSPEYPVTPKLKKILRGDGFFFYRQGKRDHEIWINPAT